MCVGVGGQLERLTPDPFYLTPDLLTPSDPLVVSGGNARVSLNVAHHLFGQYRTLYTFARLNVLRNHFGSLKLCNPHFQGVAIVLNFEPTRIWLWEEEKK